MRAAGGGRIGGVAPKGVSFSLSPADTDAMLSAADGANVAAGVEILREVYLEDTRGGDPVGLRIANDNDAVRFFIDYWSYVRWNERGNECLLSEVLFDGFVDMVLHPDYE